MLQMENRLTQLVRASATILETVNLECGDLNLK